MNFCLTIPLLLLIIVNATIPCFSQDIIIKSKPNPIDKEGSDVLVYRNYSGLIEKALTFPKKEFFITDNIIYFIHIPSVFLYDKYARFKPYKVMGMRKVEYSLEGERKLFEEKVSSFLIKIEKEKDCTNKENWFWHLDYKIRRKQLILKVGYKNTLKLKIRLEDEDFNELGKEICKQIVEHYPYSDYCYTCAFENENGKWVLFE